MAEVITFDITADITNLNSSITALESALSPKSSDANIAELITNLKELETEATSVKQIFTKIPASMQDSIRESISDIKSGLDSLTSRAGGVFSLDQKDIGQSIGVALANYKSMISGLNQIYSFTNTATDEQLKIFNKNFAAISASLKNVSSQFMGRGNTGPATVGTLYNAFLGNSERSVSFQHVLNGMGVYGATNQSSASDSILKGLAYLVVPGMQREDYLNEAVRLSAGSLKRSVSLSRGLYGSFKERLPEELQNLADTPSTHRGAYAKIYSDKLNIDQFKKLRKLAQNNEVVKKALIMQGYGGYVNSSTQGAGSFFMNDKDSWTKKEVSALVGRIYYDILKPSIESNAVNYAPLNTNDPKEIIRVANRGSKEAVGSYEALNALQEITGNINPLYIGRSKASKGKFTSYIGGIKAPAAESYVVMSLTPEDFVNNKIPQKRVVSYGKEATDRLNGESSYVMLNRSRLTELAGMQGNRTFGNGITGSFFDESNHAIRENIPMIIIDYSHDWIKQQEDGSLGENKDITDKVRKLFTPNKSFTYTYGGKQKQYTYASISRDENGVKKTYVPVSMKGGGAYLIAEDAYLKESKNYLKQYDTNLLDNFVSAEDSFDDFEKLNKAIEARNRFATPSVPFSEIGAAIDNKKHKMSYVDLKKYFGIDGAMFTMPGITPGGDATIRAPFLNMKGVMQSFDWKSAIRDIYGLKSTDPFYIPGVNLPEELSELYMKKGLKGVQADKKYGGTNYRQTLDDYFENIMESDILVSSSLVKSNRMGDRSGKEATKYLNDLYTSIKDPRDAFRLVKTAEQMETKDQISLGLQAAEKIQMSDTEIVKSRMKWEEHIRKLKNDVKYQKKKIFTGDSYEDKLFRQDPVRAMGLASVQTRIKEAVSSAEIGLMTGRPFADGDLAMRMALVSPGAFLTQAAENAGYTVTDKAKYDAFNVGDDEYGASDAINGNVSNSRYPQGWLEAFFMKKNTEFSKMIDEGKYGLSKYGLYLTPKALANMGGGDFDGDTVQIIMGNLANDIKVTQENMRKQYKKNKIPEKIDPEKKKLTIPKGTKIGADHIANLGYRQAYSSILMGGVSNAMQNLSQINWNDSDMVGEYGLAGPYTRMMYDVDSTFMKTGIEAEWNEAAKKASYMGRPIRAAYEDTLKALSGAIPWEQMPNLKNYNLDSIFNATSALMMSSIAKNGLSDESMFKLLEKQREANGISFAAMQSGTAKGEYLKYLDLSLQAKIRQMGRGEILSTKTQDELNAQLKKAQETLQLEKSRSGWTKAQKEEYAKLEKDLYKQSSILQFMKIVGLTEENVANKKGYSVNGLFKNNQLTGHGSYFEQGMSVSQNYTASQAEINRLNAAALIATNPAYLFATKYGYLDKSTKLEDFEEAQKKAEEKVQNMTYSFSNLDTFRTKSMQWYKERIKGEKEQKNEYSVIGDAFHKGAQIWGLRRIKKQHDDSIAQTAAPGTEADKRKKEQMWADMLLNGEPDLKKYDGKSLLDIFRSELTASTKVEFDKTGKPNNVPFFTYNPKSGFYKSALGNQGNYRVKAAAAFLQSLDTVFPESDYDIMGSEVKFNQKELQSILPKKQPNNTVDPINFIGFTDLVLRNKNSGKLELVDWKPSVSGSNAHDARQLQLYTAAMNSLFGEPVESASYMGYIDKAKQTVVSGGLSKAEEKAMQEEMQSLYTSISSIATATGFQDSMIQRLQDLGIDWTKFKSAEEVIGAIAPDGVNSLQQIVDAGKGAASVSRTGITIRQLLAGATAGLQTTNMLSMSSQDLISAAVNELFKAENSQKVGENISHGISVRQSFEDRLRKIGDFDNSLIVDKLKSDKDQKYNPWSTKSRKTWGIDDEIEDFTKSYRNVVSDDTLKVLTGLLSAEKEKTQNDYIKSIKTVAENDMHYATESLEKTLNAPGSKSGVTQYTDAFDALQKKIEQATQAYNQLQKDISKGKIKIDKTGGDGVVTPDEVANIEKERNKLITTSQKLKEKYSKDAVIAFNAEVERYANYRARGKLSDETEKETALLKYNAEFNDKKKEVNTLLGQGLISRKQARKMMTNLYKGYNPTDFEAWYDATQKNNKQKQNIAIMRTNEDLLNTAIFNPRAERKLEDERAVQNYGQKIEDYILSLDEKDPTQRAIAQYWRRYKTENMDKYRERLKENREFQEVQERNKLNLQADQLSANMSHLMYGDNLLNSNEKISLQVANFKAMQEEFREKYKNETNPDIAAARDRLLGINPEEYERTLRLRNAFNSIEERNGAKLSVEQMERMAAFGSAGTGFNVASQIQSFRDQIMKLRDSLGAEFPDLAERLDTLLNGANLMGLEYKLQEEQNFKDKQIKISNRRTFNDLRNKSFYNQLTDKENIDRNVENYEAELEKFTLSLDDGDPEQAEIKERIARNKKDYVDSYRKKFTERYNRNKTQTLDELATQQIELEEMMSTGGVSSVSKINERVDAFIRTRQNVLDALEGKHDFASQSTRSNYEKLDPEAYRNLLTKQLLEKLGRTRTTSSLDIQRLSEMANTGFYDSGLDVAMQVSSFKNQLAQLKESLRVDFPDLAKQIETIEKTGVAGFENKIKEENKVKNKQNVQNMQQKMAQISDLGTYGYQTSATSIESNVLSAIQSIANEKLNLQTLKGRGLITANEYNSRIAELKNFNAKKYRDFLYGQDNAQASSYLMQHRLQVEPGMIANTAVFANNQLQLEREDLEKEQKRMELERKRDQQQAKMEKYQQQWRKNHSSNPRGYASQDRYKETEALYNQYNEQVAAFDDNWSKMSIANRAKDIISGTQRMTNFENNLLSMQGRAGSEQARLANQRYQNQAYSDWLENEISKYRLIADNKEGKYQQNEVKQAEEYLGKLNAEQSGFMDNFIKAQTSQFSEFGYQSGRQLRNWNVNDYKNRLFGIGNKSRIYSQYRSNLDYYTDKAHEAEIQKNTWAARRADIEKEYNGNDAYKNDERWKTASSNEQLYMTQQTKAENQMKGAAGIGGMFKTAFASAQQALGSFLNMYVSRFIRSLISSTTQFIKTWDAALTEIQTVTLASEEQIDTIGDHMLELATNLKVSFSDVASVTTELYRQGLSDEEVAEKSEEILKFAKVSGTSTSDAIKMTTVAENSGLTSDVSGFMNIVANLGDAAATNASTITKALQKSAFAAKQAGVSDEELVAMITAISATTQLSGNVVGTSLRNIFSRMQRITTKDGIVYDEKGNSITANEFALALSSVGLSMQDTNGQTKSNTQILSEIGSIWDSLNDQQKQQIAYALGGTMQYSNVISLIDAYSDMNANGETMMDYYLGLARESEGTVDEKYEVQMESLAAAITNVQNAWQGVIESWTDTGVLTGILDIISNIITGLGTIPGAITAIAAVAAIVIPAISGLISTNPAVAGLLTAVAVIGGISGAIHNANNQKKVSYVNEINDNVSEQQKIRDENKDARQELLNQASQIRQKATQETATNADLMTYNDTVLQLKNLGVTSLNVVSSLDELKNGANDLEQAFSNAAKEITDQEVQESVDDYTYNRNLAVEAVKSLMTVYDNEEPTYENTLNRIKNFKNKLTFNVSKENAPSNTNWIDENGAFNSDVFNSNKDYIDAFWNLNSPKAADRAVIGNYATYLYKNGLLNNVILSSNHSPNGATAGAYVTSAAKWTDSEIVDMVMNDKNLFMAVAYRMMYDMSNEERNENDIGWMTLDEYMASQNNYESPEAAISAALDTLVLPEDSPVSLEAIKAYVLGKYKEKFSNIIKKDEATGLYTVDENELKQILPVFNSVDVLTAWLNDNANNINQYVEEQSTSSSTGTTVSTSIGAVARIASLYASGTSYNNQFKQIYDIMEKYKNNKQKAIDEISDLQNITTLLNDEDNKTFTSAFSSLFDEHGDLRTDITDADWLYAMNAAAGLSSTYGFQATDTTASVGDTARNVLDQLKHRKQFKVGADPKHRDNLIVNSLNKTDVYSDLAENATATKEMQEAFAKVVGEETAMRYVNDELNSLGNEYVERTTNAYGTNGMAYTAKDYVNMAQQIMSGIDTGGANFLNGLTAEQISYMKQNYDGFEEYANLIANGQSNSEEAQKYRDIINDTINANLIAQTFKWSDALSDVQTAIENIDKGGQDLQSTFTGLTEKINSLAKAKDALEDYKDGKRSDDVLSILSNQFGISTDTLTYAANGWVDVLIESMELSLKDQQNDMDEVLSASFTEAAKNAGIDLSNGFNLENITETDDNKNFLNWAKAFIQAGGTFDVVQNTDNNGSTTYSIKANSNGIESTATYGTAAHAQQMYSNTDLAKYGENYARSMYTAMQNATGTTAQDKFNSVFTDTETLGKWIEAKGTDELKKAYNDIMTNGATDENYAAFMKAWAESDTGTFDIENYATKAMTQNRAQALYNAINEDSSRWSTYNVNGISNEKYREALKSVIGEETIAKIMNGTATDFEKEWAQHQLDTYATGLDTWSTKDYGERAKNILSEMENISQEDRYNYWASIPEEMRNKLTSAISGLDEYVELLIQPDVDEDKLKEAREEIDNTIDKEAVLEAEALGNAYDAVSSALENIAKGGKYAASALKEVTDSYKTIGEAASAWDRLQSGQATSADYTTLANFLGLDAEMIASQDEGKKAAVAATYNATTASEQEEANITAEKALEAALNDIYEERPDVVKRDGTWNWDKVKEYDPVTFETYQNLIRQGLTVKSDTSTLTGYTNIGGTATYSLGIPGITISGTPTEEAYNIEDDARSRSTVAGNAESKALYAEIRNAVDQGGTPQDILGRIANIPGVSDYVESDSELAEMLTEGYDASSFTQADLVGWLNYAAGKNDLLYDVITKDRKHNILSSGFAALQSSSNRQNEWETGLGASTTTGRSYVQSLLEDALGSDLLEKYMNGDLNQYGVSYANRLVNRYGTGLEAYNNREMPTLAGTLLGEMEGMDIGAQAEFIEGLGGLDDLLDSDVSGWKEYSAAIEEASTNTSAYTDEDLAELKENLELGIDEAMLNDLYEYEDAADEIKSTFNSLKKGGKDAASAITSLTNSVRTLSNARWALEKYKSGDRSDDVLGALSSSFGYNTEDLENATGMELQSYIDNMDVSLDDQTSDLELQVESAVDTLWDEVLADVPTDFNVESYIHADGSFDASGLISAMQSLGTEAGTMWASIVEGLLSLGVDLKFITTQTDSGLKISTSADASKTSTAKRSGGGGGGKSAAEKLVDEQKKKKQERDHMLKMIQYRETEYQNADQLTNYGSMLEYENKWREEQIPIIQSNIEALKAQLSTVTKGSDDWYTLTQAIMDNEEEIEEHNKAIDENTQKIEENEQAILKLHTDLENTVDTEIKNRIQKERDMNDGTVDMQTTVLDAIKQRYQDEWDQ